METIKGKAAAVEALRLRRLHPPKKVNDATLPAGSPMHFYCISCGALADVKDELYTTTPARLCGECQAMQDLGWLE